MKEIQQGYLRQSKSEHEIGLLTCYTNPYSIDNWRHTRMLDLTKPIWLAYPGSEWITVGYGRYGSDVSYLDSHGVSVTATSLTDNTLKYAHEKGCIRAFQGQNEESISLHENTLDFVL
jgi:hypothetical protein